MRMVYLTDRYFQSDLLSMTIYDLANDQDHTQLYNILAQPKFISSKEASVQSSNSKLGASGG